MIFLLFHSCLALALGLRETQVDGQQLGAGDGRLVLRRQGHAPGVLPDQIVRREAAGERLRIEVFLREGGAVADEGDGAGEDDPMLRPAIELAVESGKISTSLIQRRLSLGYGRAAKLIDRMEQLGYVGAPEGQKPREVLITKEQFMEMVLRDTDS